MHPHRLQPAGANAARVAQPAGFPLRWYWASAPILAVVMIAIVGARVHEPIPLLPKIRPALTLALIGGSLALARTHAAVLRRAASEPLFKLAVAYTLWAAITVPFSLWKGLALESLQAMIPSLVLLFIVLLCPPIPSKALVVQRGFVLACAVTGIEALVVGTTTGGRLSSPGGTLDPNDLAAVMALSFPLALGLVSRERSMLLRIAWLAAAAVLVLTLVRTSSRGGQIAISVAALVYVMGQRGGARVLWLAAVCLGAAGAWAVGTPEFRERTRALLRGEEDYNYTAYSGRKLVWQRARQYAIENPVFGVGVGNFPMAEGETCKRLQIRGCKWSTTHNAYLQSASELGLVGGAIYVALLLVGARIGLRLWRPSRAAGAGRPPPPQPDLLASLCGFAAGATFLSLAYFHLLFGLLGLITLTARAAGVSGAGGPGVRQGGPATAGDVPSGAAPARIRGMRGRLAVAGLGDGVAPALTTGRQAYRGDR